MRIVEKIKHEVEEFMECHHAVAHEYSHALRVHNLCSIIGEEEGADIGVLGAAALLHDVGRGYGGKEAQVDHAEKSAQIAEKMLRRVGFPEEKIPHVLYAIRTHSFSKHTTPRTLEARILQDADRVDISGAVGVAMTFAYGGAYRRKLYDVKDPLARGRKLNDGEYTLDHFYTKLLKLPEIMHTRSGKKLAEGRRKFTESYLEQFMDEVEGRR